MRGREENVDARFPVIVPAMPGNVCASVAFAITTVLGNDDRSGEVVRTKRAGIVAGTGGETPEQSGRGHVLKIDLSARFVALRILAVAGGLLHALVGNGIAGFAVRDGEAQAVLFRKITFVRSGEPGAV